MSRLSQQPTLTSVANDDLIPIVDVSDTSASVDGTTKIVSASTFAASMVQGYRKPHGIEIYPDATGPTSQGGSTSYANNTSFWLFYVDRPAILSELRVTCITLQSGALLRLGIYTVSDWNTTSVTGSLLVDYGTVSGATIGNKSAGGSQLLGVGWYAIATACSNHSTVRWYRAGSMHLPIHGFSWAYMANQLGWLKTGTDYSGGLPSTIPSPLVQFTAANPEGKAHPYIVLATP